MGNFSKDPNVALQEALDRGYSRLLFQQGKPVLDRELNLLADLASFRRLARYLGDGVPAGSNGFAVDNLNVENNDFDIAAGLCLVNGQEVRLANPTTYKTQPNNGNVVSLPEGKSNVYLRVFPVEVNKDLDADLGNPGPENVGFETSVREKTDWEILVSGEEIPDKPDHFFLAEIDTTDKTVIDRRRQVSPRREIAYRRGKSPDVLVDTEMFLTMLEAVRNNVSKFLEFLTTKFVNPAVSYSAAEVMGFESLRAIASLADHGIALVNARVLDTRGALSFFAQLFEAESRFLNVWKNALLPLITAQGRIYDGSFKSMVETIERFLLGPAPEVREGTPRFHTIAEAIKGADLLEARRSQDKINEQFATEITKPTGFLRLAYVGTIGPQGNIITPGNPFDLKYRVSGSVTPDDTLQVDPFIDSAWKIELRNFDGSTPLSLKLGPGADNKDFLVTVTPSNDPSSTLLSLVASATHNSGGLNHTSGQIRLAINEIAPESTGIAFTIGQTNMIPNGGVFFAFKTDNLAYMTFRLLNNTDDKIQVIPSVPPVVENAGWEIIAPQDIDRLGQQIPAQSHRDYTFQFLAPTTIGQTLQFGMSAFSNIDDRVATIQVTLKTAG